MKLKKRIKTAIVLLIIMTLLIIVSMKIYFTDTLYVNVNFAESVVLEFISFSENDSYIIELKEEDSTALKQMFSGRFYSPNYEILGEGKCPRGEILIVFSSDIDSITISPALDGCNNSVVIINQDRQVIKIDDNDLQIMWEIITREIESKENIYETQTQYQQQIQT